MSDALGVNIVPRDGAVDLRDDQGRYVIAVTGEIDIANAPKLHERLVRAFDVPSSEVIVDLSKVSFIDSTGLGVLVNARQRSRNNGSSLKLILPHGQARFPFEVTGLAELFDLHTVDSQETA